MGRPMLRRSHSMPVGGFPSTSIKGGGTGLSCIEERDDARGSRDGSEGSSSNSAFRPFTSLSTKKHPQDRKSDHKTTEKNPAAESSKAGLTPPPKSSLFGAVMKRSSGTPGSGGGGGNGAKLSPNSGAAVATAAPGMAAPPPVSLSNDMTNNNDNRDDEVQLLLPLSNGTPPRPVYRSPQKSTPNGRGNNPGGSSPERQQVKWDPSTPQHPNANGNGRTPLSAPRSGGSHNNNLSNANSPGGFALLKVLDSFTNPLNFDDEFEKRRDGDEALGVSVDEETGGDVALMRNNSNLSGSSSCSRLDDWQQAWLDLPRCILPNAEEDNGEGGRGRSTLEGDGTWCAASKPPTGKDSDKAGPILSVYAAPTQASSRDASSSGGPKQDGSHVATPSSSSAVEALGVGVMDWSIKRRLRIECHPGRILPGDPIAVARTEEEEGRGVERSGRTFPDEGKVERLVMDMFLNRQQRTVSETAVSSTPQEMTMARWRSGLYYWQHPAIHPLPVSIFNTAAATTGAGATADTAPLRRFGSGVGVGAGSAEIRKGLTKKKRRPTMQRSLSRESSNLSDSKASTTTTTETKLVPGREEPSIPSTSSITASDLIRATRGGSNAPLNQRVRMAGCGSLGGLGHSHGNSAVTLSRLVEQREREWQDAFRSMFFSWLGQVEELGRKMAVEGDTWAAGDVSRCFYAVSPGQVVLFRAGFVRNRSDFGDDTGNRASCAGRGGRSEFEEEIGGAKKKKNSENPAANVVPMIILSSSDRTLRSKLKSMGATLRLLGRSRTGANNDEEFDERLLEFSPSRKGAVGKVDEEEATLVREELEALRRASNFGENAGADVSVSMMRKAGPPAGDHGRGGIAKSNGFPHGIPPLYMYGEGDCMAFYQLFLNSLGRMEHDPLSNDVTQQHGNLSSSQNKNNAPSPPTRMDVPLLLSRSIGPCVHSTLRSLSVSSRRPAAVHGQATQVETTTTVEDDARAKKEGDSQPQQQQHSSIELRGPILPCAVQELLCSSASYLLLDKKNQECGIGNEAVVHEKKQRMKLTEAPAGNESAATLKPSSEDCRREGSEENTVAADVGSHYFLMHMQTYEGERHPLLDLDKASVVDTTTGGPSSAWFNGYVSSHICHDDVERDGVGDHSTDHRRTKDCNHGEVMSMTVWDVTRPSVVAFKTESASSLTPPS